MGTYRLNESYDANYNLGPDFQGPIPAADETGPITRSFLGLPVRSRLGIAAGLLLNSKWIALYARLGFDLLTYKTVRSGYRPCYPTPNWIRVRLQGSLPADPELPLFPDPDRDHDIDHATWAVCFGMPSKSPDDWRPDVRLAKEHLRPGQLLNVSVVGTPGDGGGLASLASDYARCAEWAADAGADLIEANISCPNVCTAEGQIYHDLVATSAIAKAIRTRIGKIPLLLKAGFIPDPTQLGDFLECASEHAHCVVMANAIQRRVLHNDGSPVFGPYERVGILGHAIHKDCVTVVEWATNIARQRGLDIRIAGVGGVSTAAEAKAYLDAGAEAVFLGSSPMVKPMVAQEIKSALSAI